MQPNGPWNSQKNTVQNPFHNMMSHRRQARLSLVGYEIKISSAVSDGIPALPEPLGRRCPGKVLQAAEKKALGRRESPQRRRVRQKWRWRRRGVSLFLQQLCKTRAKIIGLWTKLVSSPARSLTDDGGGLGAGTHVLSAGYTKYVPRPRP